MDFFKFLKLLFYNRKLKKYLIILFIFIITLFIFRNFVFATPLTTFTYTYNNNTITIHVPSNDERLKYVVLWTDNISTAMSTSGYFYFYSSKQPIKFVKNRLIPSNYDIQSISNPFYYGKYYTQNYSNSAKRDTFEIINSNLTNSSGASQTSTYFKVSNNDIVIYENNGTTVSGTFQGAQPLESYSVFPYILNGAEDLGLGGQDIIIMPRRLS